MRHKIVVIAVLLCLLSFVSGVLITSAWGEQKLPTPEDGITTKDVQGVVCTIPEGAWVFTDTNRGAKEMLSYEAQYVNAVQIWSKEGKPDVFMFKIKGLSNSTSLGMMSLTILKGGLLTIISPSSLSKKSMGS